MLLTALPPLPNRALIPNIFMLEYLGVSRETLKNWWERGDFPRPIRVGKSAKCGRYYFRRSDVVAWLTRQSDAGKV